MAVAFAFVVELTQKLFKLGFCSGVISARILSLFFCRMASICGSIRSCDFVLHLCLIEMPPPAAAGRSQTHIALKLLSLLSRLALS